jgi:hypothetical protein
MNQFISKWAAGLYFVLSAKAQNGAADNDEADKVRIGYEITPVPLNVNGLNPALVGLGSYIVNSHSGCSDCHTGRIMPREGTPTWDSRNRSTRRIIWVEGARFLAESSAAI